MKSISIYAVTRNQNIGQLQKLERQLSGREYFLKMRTWELESMRSLVRELEAHMDEVYALQSANTRFLLYLNITTPQQ